MLKKHSFSPNHKVVSGKHNFHPQGQPSTASMGGPPQSVGGESGPSDGSSDSGGGMDGMNFCNGGMKYADGGNIFDRAGEAVSRGADVLLNSDAHKYDVAHEKPSMPLSAGDKDQPSKGIGGQEAEDTMNAKIKAMGG